jgi:hypothetical protein
VNKSLEIGQGSRGISGTSGNVTELYRRLEDTGHVLTRPQRTFPEALGPFFLAQFVERGTEAHGATF